MAQNLPERIIEAAVDYIGTSGPEGLSLRQIAADAGVSHQAPYHHFGDRSAIFDAIALDGFRRFAADLRAPVGPNDDPDLAVRLCERYVDFALRNKGYFRVMFRSDLCRLDSVPGLRDAADAAFQTLVDAVQEMVGDSASVDDVRVQATAMWSVAHGLATLLIDGPLERKIGTVQNRHQLINRVAHRMQDGLLQHPRGS